MSNKYKYKEKDYIRDILENGFVTKYVGSELKLIAKWYKEEGMDSEKIKDELQNFCKVHIKNYNKAIHYKIINSAVNYAKNEKNKLIHIDSVSISKLELDTIESMDISHDYQRVVFTMMVMNKLGKEFIRIRDGVPGSNECYFGGYKNFRELVSLANITFNKKKNSKVKNIHDLIHLLDEKGIVEIGTNGNIKLLFMYGFKTGGDFTLSVSDFQTIGFYYDYYHGENKVKECENCGTLIKAKSNNTKYCIYCAENKERERKRDKWHEINKRNYTSEVKK
ncbi:hypothetical protein QU593_09870 [Rossellomorea marisflavi]|uniref:hypothetical protein n=1 Tax=Rossellomorea marisflavi TaxID=189381 RepID=UPI0025B02466|nr:hypothetical protein [Rossellomorea marisflavi]WJV20710.1 hypothetical protein QU593_09870 [Rossellomorea marisflavi]